MAAKKWPKWLAGVSSVVSFTTFLYLTQNHGGYMANKQENLSESDQPANTQGISPLPIRSVPTDFIVESIGQVKTFIHSREEMQEIQRLAQRAKSERERLLEHLDWSDPHKQVTLPPKKKMIAEAVVPQEVKKPQVNVNPRPNSERRTKRS